MSNTTKVLARSIDGSGVLREQFRRSDGAYVSIVKRVRKGRRAKQVERFALPEVGGEIAVPQVFRLPPPIFNAATGLPLTLQEVADRAASLAAQSEAACPKTGG